jgi:nitrogen fixation protein FixH
MSGMAVVEHSKSNFHLTGWKVLCILIAFFGVIMAVNFVMAYYAIHTFSGMQTEKPYESGLAYNRAISEAKAQASRGWHVDIGMERAADGTMGMNVTLNDAASHPLDNLNIKAALRSPIDSKRDHVLALVGIGFGKYTGVTSAEAGQWDVEIIAESDHATVYRSINRIIIH